MSSNLIAETDLPKPGIHAGGYARWVAQRIKPIEDTLRTLHKRIELGDVPWFLYLTALIRQYFWVVSNSVLAWVLTCSFALTLWCFGLAKKKESEGLTYLFYLIVALPLFGVFAIRFVYPDVSYDVLNYHIIAAERSLRGYPFAAGDFFPIDFPANPIPDMVTGIYRHLLGYRVGTIVNYLTLVWTATILVKFIRAYLSSTLLVYIAVSLIVLTETLLFEINNYMVDLLALPLLLQATYLVLRVGEGKTIGYNQFQIALLLGLSIAFKLTNVVFVIPIVLIWAKRLLGGKFKFSPIRLMLVLLVFTLPVIPFTIHLYSETGSPLFPLYNNLFKSPYWTFTNFEEPNFGPAAIEQVLVWPLLLYSKVSRISQLQVYAGRIPLGFVVAFLYLALKRVEGDIRALSFIMIACSLLWSLTTGVTRYACYLELIGGMLVVYLFWFVKSKVNLRDSLKLVLIIFTFCVLTAQSVFSLSYVNHYEWSMRPTLFYNYKPYVEESRFLFQDYSLNSFLSAETSAQFDKVEVWIKCAPLMSCLEGMLKPDNPAINLRSFVSFETQEARDRFARVIDGVGNKKMFSLCYTTDIKPTVDTIARRGLGVGQIKILSVPYYSYHTLYNLALIEVLPQAVKGQQPGNVTFTSAGGPLPAPGFRASVAAQNLPASLKAGSKATVYLTVENVSTVNWPAMGRKDAPYSLNLGNHWLGDDGKILIFDDARTGLPYDLKPGDEIQLPLTITAPANAGDYILEIDMVQEQVAWFSGMGSKTLRIKLHID